MTNPILDLKGDANVVNERTKVSLTISSWYHVIVLVGAVVWLYFMLRSDIHSALEIASRAIEVSAQNSKDIQEIKLNEQSIKDDLFFFRKSYEDDAIRYIREPKPKESRR